MDLPTIRNGVISWMEKYGKFEINVFETPSPPPKKYSFTQNSFIPHIEKSFLGYRSFYTLSTIKVNWATSFFATNAIFVTIFYLPFLPFVS